MADQDFLYFVSYARDDLYVQGSQGLREEEYLAQFFADLREAVRIKAGRLQRDRVDFRDTEQIPLGVQWRQVVLDGLQACRTLVSLYTPTFFGRPECGVEVGFMHRRCTSRYAQGTAPHNFIIPIVWVPGNPAQIPSIMKGLNYFYAELPPAYMEYGLRVLARQAKFKTEYEQSVEAIATQIDLVRQMEPLPPLADPPGPEEFSNVFAAGAGAAGAAAARNKVKGAHGVRFAYVAAARPEVGQKSYQTPYGDRSEEWQPSTTDDRMVGVVAPAVATSSGFIPYQLALDATFPAQVAQAQQDNALVVLLVDAWTACMLPKYRDRMQEYDAHSSVHCATLVIWNEADTDIAQTQPTFEMALQRVVFPVNHSRALPYFHKNIRSVSDLEISLRETLERLRNVVTEKAEAFRALQALEFSVRPAVSNVSGAPTDS